MLLARHRLRLFRVVVTTVLVLAVLVPAASLFAADRSPPLRLRVLTYNLWHGGDAGKQPLERSADVIRISRADIVGVQETAGRGPNNTRPSRGPALARLLDWHFFDQQNNNGILSRHAIVAHTAGRHGAKIALPDGRFVWVFNVHLPPRPYQPYQVYKIPQPGVPFLGDASTVIASAKQARGNQVQALLAEIDTIRGDATPIFVVGDFNEPSALDWTPAAAAAGRCVFPVAWPASVALHAAGFVDAYRRVHPDPVRFPGLTWTPVTAESDPRDRHDRIDYVFVGGTGIIVHSAETIGEKRSHADHVVAPFPSDHRAVVVETGLPR